MQDTNTVFLDGEKEYVEPKEYYKNNLNNGVNYEEEVMPDFTNGKWFKRPRKDVCEL